jgi:hypothetical protein
VLVNGVLKERGETKSVRCENAIDTATAVAQVEGYARETLLGTWMKLWRGAQIKVRRGLTVERKFDSGGTRYIEFSRAVCAYLVSGLAGFGLPF